MKLKIFSLLLLILAACSDVPEIKPSPPYGANGSLCGALYNNWNWYTPNYQNVWSGDPWTGNRTVTFTNIYLKPASAGSTFVWPEEFTYSIIRVYNLGKCKFRATYGDWSQDVSVGGYADFYYSWTPGNWSCNQQIPNTSFPVTLTFYRISCGTTSGNPQPGYYVFYPSVHLQSVPYGHGIQFTGDGGYSSSVSTCTN